MARRVVLDTNVLISSLLFGGIPRQIFERCLNREFIGVTSNILLSELTDVLIKKFDFDTGVTAKIRQKLLKKFLLVFPKVHINVLKDQPDNRVLEAAVAGKCENIITGDKELLALKQYKGITILTPAEFVAV